MIASISPGLPMPEPNAAEVESLLGRVRVVADPAKSHYEQSEVTVLVPGAAPISS